MFCDILRWVTQKNWTLCRCTYRARCCSRHEGDGKSGFSGVIAFTQPALALLIVVPVHCWEGHVSEERGPQTPPQRPPTFWLHCWADAVGQLPVRLFLWLQLGTDQFQRADHCGWTHWPKWKQWQKVQNTNTSSLRKDRTIFINYQKGNCSNPYKLFFLNSLFNKWYRLY